METALRLGVNTLFYLPGEVGGSETYLLETLRALARRSDRPDLVLFSNAENDGLLRAEFPAAEVVAQCMQRGVLVLTAKGKVRLLPALNIPAEQLAKAIGILADVCAE